MEIRTFSPKELAQLVGVSESSIKRWVDDGLITVTRTAGGHRRIRATDALRFIRRQKMQVLRPELLGLPDVSSIPLEVRTGELTADLLFHLLRSGEGAVARGILVNHFLEGGDLPELFDGPVAEALRRLGELWKHAEGEGIYLEHRATVVCIEAVNEIRLLIEPPAPDAPLALGGAPAGDPYLLNNLMAAAVLADAGFRTLNLGADTPAGAFLHAVADARPDLVWVAVTSHFNRQQMGSVVRDLVQPLLQQERDVVVGGQGALATMELWPEKARLLSTMAELSAYAMLRRQGAA